MLLQCIVVGLLRPHGRRRATPRCEHVQTPHENPLAESRVPTNRVRRQVDRRHAITRARGLSWPKLLADAGENTILVPRLCRGAFLPLPVQPGCHPAPPHRRYHARCGFGDQRRFLYGAPRPHGRDRDMPKSGQKNPVRSGARGCPGDRYQGMIVNFRIGRPIGFLWPNAMEVGCRGARQEIASSRARESPRYEGAVRPSARPLGIRTGFPPDQS